MRFLALFFLLLCASLAVAAQDVAVIVIEGQVYKEGSRETLPYANVALQNNKIGTVSNASGKFRINIPERYKNERLQISYIGYKTASFKISEIPPNFSCFLEENIETMSEVAVTGLTAQYILRKALQKIPDNYYRAPYTSKGFYRLTSKKESSYVRLSEAVFALYQAGPAEKGQFKLEKMRAVKDEKALAGLEVGLKPESVFSFDVVNTLDDWDILNKKGLRHHDFYLEGTYPYHDTQVYVIGFDQKAGLKKAAYRGRLFIDKETFAFVHLDFGLSPKGLPYHKYGSAALRALMLLLDKNIKEEKAQYKISYRKIGNKYYLSKAGIDNIFVIKSSRDHLNFKLDSRVDFYISAIETENSLPFAKEVVLGSNDWIEQQHAIYDAAFWDDYNILLPDVDFTALGKAIEAKNKANNHKAEIESRLRKYPQDIAGRIDSLLLFYNRKDLFNGNALVEYKGEVIFQKSYNNALTDNRQDSRFRIGSTSKTFTAMLIMMLENEEKLALSDSVGRYLPAYIHSGLTIAQLLTHQSGIHNFTTSEKLAKIFNESYSLEEVVREFCSDPLAFEPGTQFQYSNSGYALLSLMIEKITGKAFAQVLQEKIFDPLHMNNTYYGTAADTAALAVAYLNGKPEPRYFVHNMGGAGGITSTAADLLKWSRALDQHILLPPESTDALFVPRAAYTDWQGEYGFGWMLDNFMFYASKKHQLVYHPGTDLGFYTMFLKQPDQNITVILLNNTGEFPRFEITDLILNELN